MDGRSKAVPIEQTVISGTKNGINKKNKKKNKSWCQEQNNSQVVLKTPEGREWWLMRLHDFSISGGYFHEESPNSDCQKYMRVGQSKSPTPTYLKELGYFPKTCF